MVGPGRRIAADVMAYFRYAILKQLEKEGLFAYLEEPHTYGQILAQFNYVDSDYTRELIEMIATEKENVLIKKDGYYRVNPEHPLPTQEDLFRQTQQRNYDFVLLAENLSINIPYRLRSDPVEFKGTFEEQGREMMQTFDSVLGNQFYSISRMTVFHLLTRKDREWLRGKRLLDIGCGSGRETAELWLMFDGDIQITAVDPVPSLLERARQNFPALLKELDPSHPPITDKNRPHFQEASATQLPFEDNSFDAIFHSHILHWTLDPRIAITEMARVLKPGGMIFGVQTCKPYTSMYTDIIMRSNENVYGFFWREELLRWHKELGINLDIATPLGAFRSIRN